MKAFARIDGEWFIYEPVYNGIWNLWNDDIIEAAKEANNGQANGNHSRTNGNDGKTAVLHHEQNGRSGG